jgi:hypothetical protein
MGTVRSSVTLVCNLKGRVGCNPLLIVPQRRDGSRRSVHSGGEETQRTTEKVQSGTEGPVSG